MKTGTRTTWCALGLLLGMEAAFAQTPPIPVAPNPPVPPGSGANYGTLGTFDAGSPSLPTGAGGADVVRKYAGQTAAVQVTRAALGIPASVSNPRILSLATRDDEFPIWSFFYLPPPASGGSAYSALIRIHFTASASSSPPNLIQVNASSVYGVEWTITSEPPPGGPPPTHYGIGPFFVGGQGVTGDVRRALLWADVPPTPCYFTVDPATALAMSTGATTYSSYDILRAAGNGTAPVIALSGASLGLVPGDVIDSLSVNRLGCVLFSLAPGSPSLGVAPAGPRALGATAAVPSPALVFYPTADTIIGYVPLSAAASVCAPPAGSLIQAGTLFDYKLDVRSLLGSDAPGYSELNISDLAFHDPLGREFTSPPALPSQYAFAEGSFPLRGAAADPAPNRFPLTLNGMVGNGIQYFRMHSGTDLTVSLDMTGSGGVSATTWALIGKPGRPAMTERTALQNYVPAGAAAYGGMVYDPFDSSVFGVRNTVGFLDTTWAYLFPATAPASTHTFTIPGIAIPDGTMTLQGIAVTNELGSPDSGGVPALRSTNAITMVVGPPIPELL